MRDHAPTTWSWRPRAGYPSVPRWLFVLVLVAVIVALFVLIGVTVGFDDTGSPGG
jgi:hypothetical protein